MAKKGKTKKEKITYIDDGRTIADMSGISGRGYTPEKKDGFAKPLRYRSPLREQLRTFFNAMGFMLLPTLAIVGILTLAFVIMYLLF